ncbi:hypothetical protein CPJCM30710_28260 [Clostridium polyendosporum]|uniref:Uncharacterized protein n=1 Tax=Clostridium polyendosporum TaxID=69208 RepID=A0A919S2Q2_9CLOT|nr:hypothetical protein [Clostridium polyendosporum]GIM30160.1 hypothetical protein CPJCM30710_28260 [Clostridium polyendosporum]
MQNNNRFYQCPYTTWLYYNYPIIAQDSYRYHQRVYNDFYNQPEDYEEETNLFEEPIDEDTVKEDIVRVIRLIEERLQDEYTEIISTGLDKRVLRYIAETIVEYIDKNYDKYEGAGTADEKTAAAIRDLRKELPWIFKVMDMFGVLPATVTRFISRSILIAFGNLRPQVSTLTPPIRR